MMGVPGGMPPRLDGTTVAESMQALAAGVPWRSVTASMTLLDSHDTARFASLVGDRDRHLVGVAFLMAYPGVPMVFAGDEVGVTGDTSDLARAPFPWDDERWDDDLLDGFRSLIAARRSSAALRRGGLRWVHAGADSLTFLREAPDERVLVHLARAPHDPVVLDTAPLGVGDVVPPLHGAHPLVPVDGTITLPGGGPAAHYWTLGPLGPSR
jgi:alpha-glucosidase